MEINYQILKLRKIRKLKFCREAFFFKSVFEYFTSQRKYEHPSSFKFKIKYIIMNPMFTSSFPLATAMDYDKNKGTNA